MLKRPSCPAPILLHVYLLCLLPLCYPTCAHCTACPLGAPWNWDEGEGKLTVPLGDLVWLHGSISRGSISPRSGVALAVPASMYIRLRRKLLFIWVAL